MKTPSIPAFNLRFPLSDVRRWADEYDYADDTKVVAIGRAAGKRGCYTSQEFREVARWKSPRSRPRILLNAASAVEDATRLALSTKDERLRIGVLTLLQGVEIPTASVLLHLAHVDPYPILDVRALWTLSVDPPPAYYSHAMWMAYVGVCRSLASTADVTMRTLDRALWQYSDTMQIPEGTTHNGSRR